MRNRHGDHVRTRVPAVACDVATRTARPHPRRYPYRAAPPRWLGADLWFNGAPAQAWQRGAGTRGRVPSTAAGRKRVMVTARTVRTQRMLRDTCGTVSRDTAVERVTGIEPA